MYTENSNKKNGMRYFCKLFLVVVYCATGYRSMRAARFLQKMGNNVIQMDCGIKEWKRLKYPVVK
jgi:rhodanese-related sulfurtransferase